jgi:Cu(I)/Ag(I) efflux system membrane fusion protein
MHPQIKLPDPGKCPLCNMDLIALEMGAEDAGPRSLVMSESDKALARIQTAPVEKRFVESEVRMVGKVVYDETRVKAVSAWIPGRLDRLFVDYTGTRVTKGDHMVLLYSPQLLEAQEALIEAKKGVSSTANERSPFLRASAQRLLKSEREKLRLWGLTEDQIKNIEDRGKVEPHVQINAPLSGIVIHKNAVEGMYVKTGSPIYTVADLSIVWVELDVYELDFSWVRYGQNVEIETEAYPGQFFKGWISFIPPYMNESTRTAKVRVNVSNEDGRLKPGMFVRGVVRSRIASGGRAMDPNMAGKWICPMHHEVVKDKAGPCDICGMDLVSAASLGFIAEADETEPPLVVPVTAVLRTGKRGVVYVEVPGTEKPTYEGREVVVGGRAGDWYIIQSGIREGETVVTNGNFKIDSALQIQAKRSMMSIKAEKEEAKAAVPAEFRTALSPVYEMYFKAQVALAADEFEAGRTALSGLHDAVKGVDQKSLVAELLQSWRALSSKLTKATMHSMHTQDIAGARAIFFQASVVILELEGTFGHSGSAIHREAFCPMANDGKGATWLQLLDVLRNPFYGASMLECGEFRTEHSGDKR